MISNDNNNNNNSNIYMYCTILYYYVQQVRNGIVNNVGIHSHHVLGM
jgi:hypothetical protein